MKRFLAGTVTGIALAALIGAALLLFTDLRVTDQSVREEISHALLDGQGVFPCCGKRPSVSVPNVVGSSAEAARTALKDDGLETRFVAPGPGPATGLVVGAQDPSAGTLASPGSTISLYLRGE